MKQMNQEEQIEFVHNHCNAVRDNVIAHIRAGSMPEGWNGHELRRLLRLAFDKEDVRMMNKSRVQNFNQDVYTNGLLTTCYVRGEK